jgi:hypothetical protein
VPGTGDGDEQPRVSGPPGAAKLAGAARGSRVGLNLPGPIRGDGLGNHRVHDILLGCGPPFRRRVVDIVLWGYDSFAAQKSSVAREFRGAELTGASAHGGRRIRTHVNVNLPPL